MITTRLIPVATATSQELLIEITEPLCHLLDANGDIKPAVTVAFSNSPAQVINGNAVVTITALVSIANPNRHNGCACPQIFAETFDLAFDATTDNAITLVPGASIITKPTAVKCGKARAVMLTTTLTVTIA